MKLIALFALALSFNAFAETVLVCKGIEGSEGSTMLLYNVSSEDVPENSPIQYQLKITNNGRTVYNKVVIGRQNDVHLGLRSRGNDRSLNDAIYLDELYDVEITVNGKRYNFDCERL